MHHKKMRLLFALIAVVVIGCVAFMSTNKASAPAWVPFASDKPAKSDVKIPDFNKTKFSTDDPASIWVVVNKTRPLQPKNYVPTDLVVPNVTTSGTQYLRVEAAKATETMFAAAAKEGVLLRVDSAYRSYDRQISVYNSEVSAYGQSVADSESARPGFSEHQTGLGADLGAANGKCSITDCFANTPEGKWLAENSYKYGFLLRYTDDKTPITGYRGEAWHYRYIGTELATEMHNKGIKTLEEFFGLPAAPDYN